MLESTKKTAVPHVDQAPQEQIKNALKGFDLHKGALLINTPQVPLKFLIPKVARNKGYFAYPPQGLLYIAAKLREFKVPSRILDLNYLMLLDAQTQDKIKEDFWHRYIEVAVCESEPSFFGLTCMYEANFESFKTIAHYLKKKYPEKCLMVGGVHATSEYKEILKEKLADFAISNEAEDPLERIYSYLDGQNEIELRNVSILGRDNTLVSTPITAGGGVDFDLSNDYQLIPIDNYHNIGSLSVFSRIVGTEVPFATVLAKRGCRAKCTFCSVERFNGRGGSPARSA